MRFDDVTPKSITAKKACNKAINASGVVLPSPPLNKAMATSGIANAARPQIVACVSSPATARLRFASARLKAAGNNKNAHPARSHRSQSFSASNQSTATKDPTPRKTPEINREGLIERSYHGALSTVAVSGATLAGEAGPWSVVTWAYV